MMFVRLTIPLVLLSLMLIFCVAVAELLRRKSTSKTSSPPKEAKAKVRTTAGKGEGLGTYTADPNGPGRDRVVYATDDFVVIRDLFPKSTVHLLILPRDTEKQLLYPQDAFDDVDFLRKCRQEERKVRAMVAEELRRRFGNDSKKEKERLAAMEKEDPPDDFELPHGRDWSDGVMSGTHANPSMAHLHIHVMSRDMCGPSMKKSSHYQSFTTAFLIDLEQFPLSEDDYRRDYNWLKKNLLCWRCGRDFGRSFTKLAAHLKNELENWKQE